MKKIFWRLRIHSYEKQEARMKLEFCLQVAWMHFEQSAILTVHNHVITRNPRISVTHDKHRTWFLHISNVQEEDKGRYMCQINTVTAKTQFGYLHVVGEFSVIVCLHFDTMSDSGITGLILHTEIYCHYPYSVCVCVCVEGVTF
jgi:hypothetical protein